MTTYANAREHLITKINTAWTTQYPTTRVFYENTTKVDLDAVGTHFLAVTVDFTDSLRMEINPSPSSRTWGEAILRFFAKEGQGTKTALQVFDFLTALMKYQTFGGVTTECPAPGPKQASKGWVSFDLTVPFFFYQ